MWSCNRAYLRLCETCCRRVPCPTLSSQRGTVEDTKRDVFWRQAAFVCSTITLDVRRLSSSVDGSFSGGRPVLGHSPHVLLLCAVECYRTE